MKEKEYNYQDHNAISYKKNEPACNQFKRLWLNKNIQNEETLYVKKYLYLPLIKSPCQHTFSKDILNKKEDQ